VWRSMTPTSDARPADGAGQHTESGALLQPSARWADDDGAPDELFRRAMSAAADTEGYLQAVAAACGARLLMPIVANGDESMTGPDPERHAEMAAVSVQSASGERALLAFSGLDSLQRWRRDARPVPGTLDEVAVAALDAGSGSILVDISGPAPLHISDQLVAELAKGRRLIRLDDGGFGWLVPNFTHESDSAIMSD